MTKMRASLYFYRSIDTNSVVWRHLSDLIMNNYENFYRIGADQGFCVGGLSWSEAHNLARKMCHLVFKADCEGVFQEMRLMVQPDDSD
ncbi:hypothetical protein [Sphingomonas sp. ABOLE]|uniref:hypothetical protein n=1 Tax=Sphingomonas sp. ABOLE TaxID=1985878 RepID=UPI000F7EA049|nr:hypothetical protein [Sphingomonas sp. ABOLE]